MATFMLHVKVRVNVPGVTDAEDAANRILNNLPQPVQRVLEAGSAQVWVEDVSGQ